MIHRAEGVVLRTHRMTESSLVAVVYTRDFGKVRLAARGARRPKSRFGAGLQPVTQCQIVYYHKDGRDLQTVSEVDIVHAFDGIKRDYDRLAFASAICEMIDHMTVEEDRNAMLYSIALDALAWTERIDAAYLELPHWYFQLKAAGELGYRPHLSGCVVTGERLTGDRAWFSPELGGTTNRDGVGQGVWLPSPTRAFLEHLQTTRPDRVDTAKLSEVDVLAARRALRLFLTHHIESGRQMKAAAFLDRILEGRTRKPTYSVAAERGPAYGSERVGP